MQAVASASRPVDFATQWQGQVVDGRFPLEQYLGGSENHAVFLTRIPGGAAKAAIKLLRANSCDPDAQLAAWRRAAKLAHPNLMRIYDGGRCWLAGNDLVFVVTEYADENLGQVVPSRKLTAAEAEAMLSPVVEALAFLHGQGLIHGHVRPSNILAVNDQVKLSSESIREAASGVKQSPRTFYDAPEFGSGQLSPAADVWSLGATLAEALTQRIPRKGGANSNLPQPFADIVNHCLREEAGSRWSVAQIAARLQPHVKERAAEPDQEVESLPSPKSRALLWVIAAVVLIGIAAALMLSRRGTSATPSTAEAPATSTVTASSTTNAAPANSAGSVLNRVLPNLSRGALNTIHGKIKIRVKVAVDSGGNVTNASFVTRGPSQYFARLTLQAAQQWRFAPPVMNGQTTPSDWTELFELSRGGVEASAEPSKVSR